MPAAAIVVTPPTPTRREPWIAAVRGQCAASKIRAHPRRAHRTRGAARMSAPLPGQDQRAAEQAHSRPTGRRHARAAHPARSANDHTTHNAPSRHQTRSTPPFCRQLAVQVLGRERLLEAPHSAPPKNSITSLFEVRDVGSCTINHPFRKVQGTKQAPRRAKEHAQPRQAQNRTSTRRQTHRRRKSKPPRTTTNGNAARAQAIASARRAPPGTRRDRRKNIARLRGRSSGSARPVKPPFASRKRLRRPDGAHLTGRCASAGSQPGVAAQHLLNINHGGTMSIPRQQRDAAITVLQRIRSKVLDTEKRLMLDDLNHHHVVVRASEIQGQAEALALSVLEPESATANA